jgi:hypothetical protein
VALAETVARLAGVMAYADLKQGVHHLTPSVSSQVYYGPKPYPAAFQ